MENNEVLVTVNTKELNENDRKWWLNYLLHSTLNYEFESGKINAFEYHLLLNKAKIILKDRRMYRSNRMEQRINKIVMLEIAQLKLQNIKIE